jgi:hypothetical protein
MAAACGRESPTAVGGGLLPGGAVRTFEIILDASQFLQADTTVSGFVRASTTAFSIVAQSFGGSVSAHSLCRFVQPGTSISVIDSAGATVTDTLPHFFAATVILHVDTLAVNGSSPVLLRLFRTVEAWDAYSASWTMRVDSGSTHLPWAQAGGTAGSLVDSATYTPGADSVVFHVDSATVAAWADTTDVTRGVLVTAATAGSRLRFLSIDYEVQAHSSIKKDTVVVQSPGVVGSTFIYTPDIPPPPPGTLQIGGVPSWRTFLTFAPDLETRTLVCPASLGVSCTFSLQRATVNYAGLLLQPAPSGVWVPEDSVRPSAWVSDTSTLVPLSRAPLGIQVGVSTPAYPASIFQAPVAATPLTVPVTSFVAALAGDTARVGAAAGATRTLGILAMPEPGLFGVGIFYGHSAGALAPRLRLVVTIASEAQLP